MTGLKGIIDKQTGKLKKVFRDDAEESEFKEKQDNEILLDEILKEKSQETREARMSGKLANGLLYWTIFIKHRGEYYPFVTFENDEPIPIKKDEINNYYFEYEGICYIYSKPLFFKENYRINTIDKEAIKLLKSKTKFNKKLLYEELLDKIKEYYDHSNKKEYDLVLPFIIQTYICWGLGRTYYLIIQGKEDTGKSTLQELNARLQMNGFFGGKSSVPVMVRLKHFFGISLNQDELEKMHKEEKTNFMGVANTGYNINGTYNFVNTNKKKIEDQIQILDTFGSNSFSVNSLNLDWDFDKSFLSRCYPLMTIRKNRQTKDIHNLSEIEIKKFQELRNKLFAYCLTNYSKIEKDINEVKIELEQEGTFGRFTDLYSLILGIIKHFKGDYSEEKEELKQKEGLSKAEDFDTIEGAVFNYLSDLFGEKKESVSILNKEICSYVNNSLELPEDKRIKPRTIGAILRRFNLTTREDQVKRTNNGYEYVIGLRPFIDMLQRYGYKNQLSKINDNRSMEVSSLSSLHSLHSFQNEPNELNEHNESKSEVPKVGNFSPEDIEKPDYKLWDEEKIKDFQKEKLKELGLSQELIEKSGLPKKEIEKAINLIKQKDSKNDL